MIKRISLSLLTATLLTQASWAASDGKSTAAFLRIGQGARAEGMGGAFTAVADDAHAVYWNPAGLAQVTRQRLALDHLSYLEEINSQNAAFVIPMNNAKGSLGVNVSYVDMGSIERMDATGVPESGDTDVNAYAGTLSWGQAMGDRFAIGGGIKFINQNLAGEKGSGMAGDLGILIFPIEDKLSLGLAVSNLGSKIETGTTKEDIPQTLRAGLAVHAIPEQLTFALDTEKEKNSDAILKLGSEYIYQQTFVARIGYQDTYDASGGLSAGLGFIWRPQATSGGGNFFGGNASRKDVDDGMSIRFDYGYVDLGDFDTTHRFGIELIF